MIDLLTSPPWLRRLRILKKTKDIRYTLSGCVKPSRQEYWEYILNSDCDDHDMVVSEDAYGLLDNMTDGDPAAPCQCSAGCSRADAAIQLAKVWGTEDLRQMIGLQEHVDSIYWSFKE